MVSEPNPEREVNLLEANLNVQMLAAIPTLISAYGFNPALFGAVSSLKNPSNKNGLVSGGLAIIIVFIVYSIVPLIAYRLYGHDVKSNMLLNITQESGFIPIVLLMMFLAIAVMHIPMIFFFGKESVLIIFDEATRHSYTKLSSKVTDISAKSEHSNHHFDGRVPDQLSISHDHNDHVVHHIDDVDETLRDDDNHHHDTHHDDHQFEDHHGEEIKVQDDKHKISLERVDNSKNGFEKSNKSINKVDENRGNTGEIKVKPQKAKQEFRPNPKEYLKMKPIYYYLIILISYFIVVLLSILVGDVKIFFGIIGTTAASWAIFIGPGSFYIISVHKNDIPFNTRHNFIMYFLAWMFIFIGILVFFGLGAAVMINAFM